MKIEINNTSKVELPFLLIRLKRLILIEFSIPTKEKKEAEFLVISLIVLYLKTYTSENAKQDQLGVFLKFYVIYRF